MWQAWYHREYHILLPSVAVVAVALADHFHEKIPSLPKFVQEKETLRNMILPSYRCKLVDLAGCHHVAENLNLVLLNASRHDRSSTFFIMKR